MKENRKTRKGEFFACQEEKRQVRAAERHQEKKAWMETTEHNEETGTI